MCKTGFIFNRKKRKELIFHEKAYQFLKSKEVKPNFCLKKSVDKLGDLQTIGLL